MLVGRQCIRSGQDTDREANMQELVLSTIGIASLEVCNEREIEEGVGETVL